MHTDARFFNFSPRDSSDSAPKLRARLSEAQAIAIFQAKTSAPAVKFAAVYGVCEKAIRDIWKGRTWSRVTWHLDTSLPLLQLKQTGRPKGCCDKKPRKKRADSREEQSTSTGSTTQSPCRQHTMTDTVEREAFQLSLKQRTELSTCSLSGDSNTWHRSRGQIFQTASVDEQLHEWDEFWRGSTSTDPFCGDWKSC